MMALGLFTLIINAVLLQVAASFGNIVGIPFHVDNFGSAFLASLIISAVSILLTLLIGEPARKKR